MGDGGGGGETGADSENHAPRIRAVLVGLGRGSSARCLATVEDDDDDDVSVTYAWFVGESVVEGQTKKTLATEVFEANASITCEVTATDGQATVTARATNSISSPDVTEATLAAGVTPQELYICSAPTCEVSWSDGGAPTGTYQYTWLLNGSVVTAASGATLDGASLAFGDELSCAVGYQAAAGGSWLTAESLPVTVQNELPTLRSVSIPAIAAHGEELQCLVEGYEDADCESAPKFEIEWYLNDAVVGSGATLDTSSLATEGTLRCEVTPSDGIASGTTLTSNEAQLVPGGFFIRGELVDSLAGFSVALIDDQNGDGLGEILIGAPGATPGFGREQAGKVYLVYGKTSSDEVLLEEVTAGSGGYALSGELGGLGHGDYLCADYSGTCGEVRSVEDYGDLGVSGPLGDGLGYSVSGVGDVNGDGRSDAVVTAPFAYWDAPINQTQHSYVGKSYELLDLSDTRTLPAQLYGTEPTAIFKQSSTPAHSYNGHGPAVGHALSRAGDFNGDGYADYAVGAPLNNGTAGAAFLTYGGASRTSFYLGFRSLYMSGHQDQNIGIMLDAAGDVDGDGLSDIIVQQALESADESAAVTVVYGGYPTTELYFPIPQYYVGATWPSTIRRIANGELVADGSSITSGRRSMGWAVGGDGDVNGDGLSDVVVTAEGPDGVNYAYVVLGESARTAISLDDVATGSGGFVIVGDFVTQAKYGDVKLGDVNGDGLSDVVLCSATGFVDVVYGKKDVDAVDLTDGITEEEGFRFEVENGEERGFGRACDVGDLNGDGLADLLVGAPSMDAPSFNGAPRPDVGGVWVRFGRDDGTSADFRGGPEDDFFTGTGDDEVFLSGAGDDVLAGLGGADVFYAGPGDDRILPGSLGFRRIDGGPGLDSVQLVPAPTRFFVSDLLGRTDNVEVFDFDDASSTVLEVEAVDVRRLSTTSNLLVFKGTELDGVQSAETAWTPSGTTSWDGLEFKVFEAESATLWVQSGVSTDFIPLLEVSNATIASDAGDGALVTTAQGSDPDGNTVSYQLIDEGSLPGRFAIDASSGEITVLDAATLEGDTDTKYSLQVQVSDGARTTSVPVTITVTRATVSSPSPPVFHPEPAHYLVSSDITNGSVVGAAYVEDPTPVRYAFDSGDSAPFRLDAGTGVVYVADQSLLRAADSPYVFSILATHQNGLTATKEVTIDVVDQVAGNDSFTLFYLQPYRNVFSLEPGPLYYQDVTFDVSVGDSDQWDAIAVPGGQVETQRKVKGRFRFRQREYLFNAAITFFAPVDVSLDFPTDVALGGTYTFSSSANRREDVHAMTEFPAAQMTCELLQAGGVTADTTACVNASCDPVGASWAWSGTYLLGVADSPKVRFATTSPREWSARHYGLATLPSFDTNEVLQAIGGPSSALNMSLDVGGGHAGITLDGNQLQLACQHGRVRTARPSVYVYNLPIVLTLENGNQFDWVLGQDRNIKIPANADSNGDGRIEYTMSLTPNAAYNFEFSTHGNSTMGVWGGKITVSSQAEPGHPDYFEDRSTVSSFSKTNQVDYVRNLSQNVTASTNTVVLHGSFQVL